MKQVFFKEDGSLNISQFAKSHPSYQSIMEDKFVSNEELGRQYQLIKSLFRKLEDSCTEEQKQTIKQLIVECEVYQAIRQHFNMQVEFDGDFIV